MTATSTDPFLSADIPAQFNIAEFFLDAPASRHPHKTAIVGEPRPVSYAELAKLANRVGNALLELGISDRKSTRLNSSHVEISYAVFCLKKKKTRRRPASRVGADNSR